MPFIQKSPLEYPANTSKSIRRWEDTRAPTSTDFKQFIVGDEWLDKSSDDWWKLCYKDKTQGTWRKMSGTSAASEYFTPDIGGQVGPDAVNNINFLGDTGAYQEGSLFIGDPANNTLSVRNLRNITKYVVDPTGNETEYITIQSAIDAAQAAGRPATVYVRPKATPYTENLTFYDGIDLWGAVGVADTQTCVIDGIHIPPVSGTLTIRNIFLKSATDIFNSAVAGTCALILIDCAVAVTNGYTFNLPNWTGSFTGFDIGEIGSTNDGWINNTGGAFTFMVNITMGAGSGNTCIISGSSEFYNVHVQCPITFSSTGTSVISGGCWFDNTLTTSDTATVRIFNSLCDTGANQAITHNSTSTMILSTTSVNSSNLPAIGGSGTIEVTGLDLDDDATFAGTLTLNGGKTISGSARLLDRTPDAIAIYSTDGEVDELGPLLDGELVIGSTGNPPVAANLLSADGTITITNGAGSIDLSAAPTFVDQQNIVYVGKHGNDANDGLCIEEAKLTFGAAITAASAIAPATVVCLDGGSYTENITLLANVNIDAENATLNGSITGVDNTYAEFRDINVSSGTAIIKNTGTVYFTVVAENVTCTGTAIAVLNSSGKINLKSRAIFIENGFGLGSTSTEHVHFEVEHFYITGTGTAVALTAGATIEGQIHSLTNIGAGSGTGILNAGGEIDITINTLKTDIGLTLTAGRTNLVINEINCSTTAYNVSAGAILNLSVNSIVSGTETVAPGGVRNLWRQDGASYQSGDATFNNAASAIPRFLSVLNTDTNAASTSYVNVETPDTGADSFVHFEITGTKEFSLGIDNSDSDIFKLTDGADPSSGTEFLTLDTAATDLELFVDTIQQTYSVSSPIQLGIFNQDGAAAADSRMEISTNGALGGGDPYVNFNRNTINDFSLGMDHTTNTLKMALNGSPSGGTEVWNMTISGERTMALQPFVLATVSANQPNVTGAGGLYNMIANNVVVERGSNYNSGTGVYTIPVDGIYLLHIYYDFSNLTAANTLGTVGWLVNGTPTNLTFLPNPGVVRDANNSLEDVYPLLLPFTAGTTLQPRFVISNGAGDTVQVDAGSGLAIMLMI